jgi:hypothetical protein
LPRMQAERMTAFAPPSNLATSHLTPTGRPRMELAVPIVDRSGPGGLIMHVNKVHSVKTIDRVARELGESVDGLHDVADQMDTEDGVIWVYGDSDDGVMAFTNFGIETLAELIEMHKEDPMILERRNKRS